jgi:Mg/Co/Ni transporter MgtE
MCGVGGLGAALGSIVGHAAGPSGLIVGGLLGGILAVIIVARVAVWRCWISRAQLPLTAVGGIAGFLLAAEVAVNTLSTPVGPVLSASLIGLGALLGARFSSRGDDAMPPAPRP